MNISTDPLDDYRWLTGPEGAEWFARTGEEQGTIAAKLERLRRDLTAGRAHLLVEQVELRRRAKTKFARAEEMFFSPVGLEQATDQCVARYKASRLPAGPVADLCCGIGGDLLAVAARGPSVGVDRDPVSALLAEANLRTVASEAAKTAEIRVADVAEFPVSAFAAWHLDPDRRPSGRRTTQVIYHEPGPAVVERLLAERPEGALKLAPAAEVPHSWAERAELEWISRGRQCRQMVAWFGPLAGEPGRRRATVVGNDLATGAVLWSTAGRPGLWPPVAAEVGRYVFEPDPAVIAADLTGEVAERYGLSAVAGRIAYLTSDQPCADAGLVCFEVTDVLPFDLKRLRRLLAERGVGRLEIKKRGVPHDPEELRRKLGLRGDRAAVLLLAPQGRRVLAIVARRRPETA